MNACDSPIFFLRQTENVVDLFYWNAIFSLPASKKIRISI